MPSDSNPFYFKTPLVNWFHAIFGIMSLSMVVYNIIYRKEGRYSINYNSMLITSFFSLPIIVDSIYDVSIHHDPHRFSPEALIVILVAMTLITALGVAYLRYIGRNCSSVTECKMANGYSKVPTSTSRKSRRDADWKKSHFFVNILIFSNVLIGFVVLTAIMTSQYTLRLVSYYDSNKIRELDALYSTLVLIGMHVVFLILDIVLRKTIWGLNVVHHLILGIYILSNMIELHNRQRLIEDVSILSFLLISIPLSVINMVYLLMGRLSLFIGEDALNKEILTESGLMGTDTEELKSD